MPICAEMTTAPDQPRCVRFPRDGARAVCRAAVASLCLLRSWIGVSRPSSVAHIGRPGGSCQHPATSQPQEGTLEGHHHRQPRLFRRAFIIIALTKLDRQAEGPHPRPQGRPRPNHGPHEVGRLTCSPRCRLDRRSPAGAISEPGRPRPCAPGRSPSLAALGVDSRPRRFPSAACAGGSSAPPGGL